ncbi:uncharacterized protein LOC116592736 [Mustela erminea]|uniref:uncharacterized protein LOC116592736 n=1 Tax=Mustela erminea TaxID=36723 RepID=UPI001387590D|nr:uncharacterized protein LOC116592736 [Mustela erminea]
MSERKLLSFGPKPGRPDSHCSSHLPLQPLTKPSASTGVTVQPSHPRSHPCPEGVRPAGSARAQTQPGVPGSRTRGRTIHHRVLSARPSVCHRLSPHCPGPSCASPNPLPPQGLGMGYSPPPAVLPAALRPSLRPVSPGRGLPFYPLAHKPPPLLHSPRFRHGPCCRHVSVHCPGIPEDQDHFKVCSRHGGCSRAERTTRRRSPKCWHEHGPELRRPPGGLRAR